MPEDIFDFGSLDKQPLLSIGSLESDQEQGGVEQEQLAQQQQVIQSLLLQTQAQAKKIKHLLNTQPNKLQTLQKQVSDNEHVIEMKNNLIQKQHLKLFRLMKQKRKKDSCSSMQQVLMKCRLRTIFASLTALRHLVPQYITHQQQTLHQQLNDKIASYDNTIQQMKQEFQQQCFKLQNENGRLRERELKQQIRILKQKNKIMQMKHSMNKDSKTKRIKKQKIILTEPQLPQIKNEFIMEQEIINESKVVVDQTSESSDSISPELEQTAKSPKIKNLKNLNKITSPKAETQIEQPKIENDQYVFDSLMSSVSKAESVLIDSPLKEHMNQMIVTHSKSLAKQLMQLLQYQITHQLANSTLLQLSIEISNLLKETQFQGLPKHMTHFIWSNSARPKSTSQLDQPFYSSLLSRLNCHSENIALLQHIHLPSLDHVVLLPLLILGLVSLGNKDVSLLLHVSHSLSASYLQQRSHQNQQDRISQVSLSSTLVAGKFLLLLVYPQALFGQSVWTHQDSQEKIFLFKSSQPQSYSYSLASIYKSLPLFPKTAQDNQLSALASKHLDLLVVYQQHVLQDAHLDILSLLYLHLFYHHITSPANVYFPKAQQFFQAVFLPCAQDIPDQLVQTRAAHRPPPSINSFLVSKRLNFGFYVKNLMDWVCSAVERQLVPIQNGISFQGLPFCVEDYLNCIWLLLQQMSAQLVQSLLCQKVLDGYLWNSKFRQSLNHYLAIITYGVILHHLAMQSPQVNIQSNKKLLQHIRQDLIQVATQNENGSSSNDHLASHRLLAFVVLVNFYESFFVNNGMQLNLSYSPKQLSFLSTHFGPYYVQFYDRVRIR